MDRHNRPYKCDRAGCEASAFGDAGGLFRHQREVHRTREGDRPVTEYFCQDVSCERHKRGFPRRWNLMEHRRRVHGVDKGRKRTGDGAGAKRRRRSGSTSSSEPSRSPSPRSDECRFDALAVGLPSPRGSASDLLHAKLRELEDRRRGLEKDQLKVTCDIEAVKQVLRVMDEGKNS